MRLSTFSYPHPPCCTVFPLLTLVMRANIRSKRDITRRDPAFGHVQALRYRCAVTVADVDDVLLDRAPFRRVVLGSAYVLN
jgi:hypothetical protein